MTDGKTRGEQPQTAWTSSEHESGRCARLPLYTQVLIGVVCGTAMGMAFGQESYLGGIRNEDLGQLGMWVVTILKFLAVPLIFFAILDAFLRTSLPMRQGGKLLAICLINVFVAMAIGLVIMNTWKPGLSWSPQMDELLAVVPSQSASTGHPSESFSSDQLKPFESLAAYIPQSMLRPFSTNNVIGVVLLALVSGIVFRRLRGAHARIGEADRLGNAVETIYRLLVYVLGWVIRIIPLAVFGVLAAVVGRVGVGVFSVLWIFLAAIMLGLGLHALVYYPVVAWFIGGKSPKDYLGKGADAILTAVSCNSSLATVPVTLRCLERMNVSPESARLAACVGTNLNNDGITLYEAMAALFLAQALGFNLPMANQLLIVLASIMAGVGVAGIPEAGLIVLPLVLSAAGLPNHIIAAAIPLVLTVDWIIARARSGVNVMSDMLVAILLDLGQKVPPATESAPILGKSAASTRVPSSRLPAS